MTTSDPTSTLERDPVCGMNVSRASAKHVHEHAGKNYYFCCAGCTQKFKADPQKYLNPPLQSSSKLVTLGMPSPARPLPLPQQNAAAAAAHVSDYVCPMCPEVRQ